MKICLEVLEDLTVSIGSASYGSIHQFMGFYSKHPIYRQTMLTHPIGRDFTQSRKRLEQLRQISVYCPSEYLDTNVMQSSIVAKVKRSISAPIYNDRAEDVNCKSPKMTSVDEDLSDAPASLKSVAAGEIVVNVKKHGEGYLDNTYPKFVFKIS